MFQAGTIRELAYGRRTVDMEAAKAGIRMQRRMLSGELQRAEREKEAQKKKLRRVKAWWYTRRQWRSMRVGNRIGKISPHYHGATCFVEFPDGDCAYVSRW